MESKKELIRRIMTRVIKTLNEFIQENHPEDTICESLYNKLKLIETNEINNIK